MIKLESLFKPQNLIPKTLKIRNYTGCTVYFVVKGSVDSRDSEKVMYATGCVSRKIQNGGCPTNFVTQCPFKMEI